jgi:hypothetical protein
MKYNFGFDSILLNEFFPLLQNSSYTLNMGAENETVRINYGTCYPYGRDSYYHTHPCLFVIT